ncbi:hypothetical protein SAMD00023353_9500240 [Rosellinia necatrix]|uniref:Uncharacterized protein n=1 Tax=Rosellinia necatrix TaxID=77044 RepID=A0A1S8AAY4_ROSNE|nr:hypothetical protein SAMD00023353_9500240 [Rosellinia necatrix]
MKSCNVSGDGFGAPAKSLRIPHSASAEEAINQQDKYRGYSPCRTREITPSQGQYFSVS